MGGRPYANRLGMAVSTLMAIQSQILKVNILLDHYTAFYTTETISHIYELKLSELNLNKFKDIPSESFANLTLREANNYVNRAIEEASQNLYAQAVIDLIIAEILYHSVSDLIRIPDPFLKTTTVNITELVEIKNSIISRLVEINKGNKIDKLIISKLLFYPIEDIKFIQTLINRRMEINKIDNKALTYLYAFLERALIYLENLNKKLVTLQSNH